jgi:DNA invertase Pin-like site-specific DNA recombinase
MTDTGSARKAVIYTRISQDRTGAGMGVERQEQDCKDLANNLGWEVVAVYTDNDISAYSGKRRPGYEVLLADLEAGRATDVLASHTDRLHRSNLELERYITICDSHGVITHTVQADNLDLSTSSGRMTARIVGAVAQQESEHKGERVRRARQQKAQAGGWNDGKRPFGFEPDGLTIRESEAAEIRKAAEAILSGASLRSVVRHLNQPLVLPPLYPVACRPFLGAERPLNAVEQLGRGECFTVATVCQLNQQVDVDGAASYSWCLRHPGV